MSIPSNPNPNRTQLDAAQCEVAAFDGDNEAYRVFFPGVHASAISLSAADNDSVISYVPSTEYKSSLTTASTGIILGPVPCAGMKSFQLYTNTTATLTGPQVCTLQVSPSDTDDVWIATTLTVTPSGTLSTVVAGTENTSICARRARVSIAAAISTGTFDLYLNMQAV